MLCDRRRKTEYSLISLTLRISSEYHDRLHQSSGQEAMKNVQENRREKEHNLT